MSYILDPRFSLVTSATGARVVSLAAAGATPPKLPVPGKSGAGAAAADKGSKGKKGATVGPDGKPLSKNALKRLQKGKGKKKDVAEKRTWVGDAIPANGSEPSCAHHHCRTNSQLQSP